MSETKQSIKFSDLFAPAILVVAVALLTIWLMSPPAPHPLNGEPALDVKLALLDGGTMDLPSHKGKEVVILDFWAAWCAPCRDSMPVIDKVSKEFRNKGVVLYTVNLGDSPQAIRDFLDANNLDLVVALDPHGSSAFAYQVDAIPQTVVIDKAGMITGVLVGTTPYLDKELRGLLRGALAKE